MEVSLNIRGTICSRRGMLQAAMRVLPHGLASWYEVGIGFVPRWLFLYCIGKVYKINKRDLQSKSVNAVY